MQEKVTSDPVQHKQVCDNRFVSAVNGQ